jgi:hypothetical protein
MFQVIGQVYMRVKQFLQNCQNFFEADDVDQELDLAHFSGFFSTSLLVFDHLTSEELLQVIHVYGFSHSHTRNELNVCGFLLQIVDCGHSIDPIFDQFGGIFDVSVQFLLHGCSHGNVVIEFWLDQLEFILDFPLGVVSLTGLIFIQSFENFLDEENVETDEVIFWVQLFEFSLLDEVVVTEAYIG